MFENQCIPKISLCKLMLLKMYLVFQDKNLSFVYLYSNFFLGILTEWKCIELFGARVLIAKIQTIPYHNQCGFFSYITNLFHKTVVQHKFM